MKKQIKDAIRGTGGLARLAGEKSETFAASIQPAGFEGDGHGAHGSGFLKSYKVYMEHSEITRKLRDGDIIVFDDSSYVIKSLSPSFYGGKPVYLSGILTLCEEGEA